MKNRRILVLNHLKKYATSYFIVALFLVCIWRICIRAGAYLPLGYDAGLYKRMALEVTNLSYRDRNNLPSSIQTMYEPVSMIVGSTRVYILGGRSDTYLTIGRLVIASFLPLSVYTLGKRYHVNIGILAGLLTAFSLVQHHVYRRGYRKQLLGMSMACIILAYRRRIPYWVLIGPAIYTLGINRASGILLGLRGIVCLSIYIYQKLYVSIKTTDADHLGHQAITPLLTAILLVGSGTLIIYRQVLQEQVRPLITPLLGSIDIPTSNDGYQAGGTFLTLSEYISLARYTLIPGVCAFLYSIYHRTYIHITIPTGILLIRVFGQGFFFQRMIGYLDICMILCTAIGVYEISQAPRLRKRSLSNILGGTFLLTSAAFMLYGSIRIAQPLILPLEYQAIQELNTTIEKDAVVIVSGIWYSPWITGWMTQAEVIAPGLFDHQQWGVLDEGRREHRQDQTGAQKCKNWARDFPELEGRPTYIRVGSKQMPDIYTGEDSCIQLVRDGKIRQWYKLGEK